MDAAAADAATAAALAADDAAAATAAAAAACVWPSALKSFNVLARGSFGLRGRPASGSVVAQSSSGQA